MVSREYVIQLHPRDMTKDLLDCYKDQKTGRSFIYQYNLVPIDIKINE